MKTDNLIHIDMTFWTRGDEEPRAEVQVKAGVTTIEGPLFPVELRLVNDIVQLLKEGKRYNTSPEGGNVD